MESEHFIGKVALRGVVERDGKVLVARDINDEVWEWPGGRLHIGEDPYAALAREFQEELGVSVQVGDIFYIEQWKHTRTNTPQVFIFFHCTIAPNTSPTPDNVEVAEVKWIDMDELAKIPFWEECRRAADAFLSQKSQKN